MPENAIQHSHIYSTYFAPRGRSRIFNLGIQLAQLYLSPFDQIIGVIGEAGSGKSVLIKGMFPGLELTNDDDGVNVRPLPILDQDAETGFFSPHTYHMDIRFEMGFHQLSELADACCICIQVGTNVLDVVPLDTHLTGFDCAPPDTVGSSLQLAAFEFLRKNGLRVIFAALYGFAGRLQQIKAFPQPGGRLWERGLDRVSRCS